MDLVHIEMMGFIAGAINLFSSVPQLWANLRNPDMAQGQSVSRNMFQCAGNALWMNYGLMAGSVSITCFAALGCLMAAGLIYQTMKPRRGRFA